MFAAPSSWIESDAVAQCHQVAALDGMIHVAGMPDLHPGKGAPIGAAMASTVLYPFLVGSDIGCGIAVFPVKLKRAVPEKLAARFPDLDVPLDGDTVDGDIPAGHLEGLGTVGRGNHFVELARVEKTFEPDRASRKGLAAGALVLIVHSGSRGLGERILRAHTEAHGAGRKMSRADALRRGRAKHTVEELRRTPVGSLVVCGDRQLLFEEAPTAYKRIEQVIADLTGHGLATPVATTVPLVTYKTARTAAARRR